ncbi:MAG: dTDP-4-dehydrorhamnose 3,5-epimerase [Synechococcaceae cyanobacterium]|nr:dTDP-4-dehydrorhamnose 3,5-epimerase [Synechococcaceae cyanobacterium]
MQVDRFPERFAPEPGAEPLLLTPEVLGDARGSFFEAWNRRRFAEALGLEPEAAPVFDQDNQSHSVRGVLRGLHYQLPPHPQGKLVRCLVGEIFDVAVDLRRSSPSFGRWAGVRLSAENHRQLWVPAGFGHGFLTLSPVAEVLYKVSGFWSRPCERSLRWDDPGLAIAWPLEALEGTPPILSPKDAGAPALSELLERGDVFP